MTAQHTEASRRVLEAFGADGVLEREFALAEISPVLRFPAAQAAFAPGVQVPVQAGLLDQILAMLGRDPSWPQ